MPKKNSGRIKSKKPKVPSILGYAIQEHLERQRQQSMISHDELFKDFETKESENIKKMLQEQRKRRVRKIKSDKRKRIYLTK